MADPREESDEIIAEDWPTYWTQVPVWVLLADTSGQAYKLYGFLAEHINGRQPGKRIACPKQTAIARVLGLKNPRQVAKYSGELEELGAVRVTEYRYANGMRRGYRYHVRFNPPPGYVGAVSLSHFYDTEDRKSVAGQGRVAVAMGAATPAVTHESAGQPGGTKNSTSGGAKNSTSRGTKNSTAERDQEERDQREPDAAPSARSANDGRRPSTSSSARATGGSAASGKSRHRLTKAEYEAIRAVRDLLPVDLEKALPAKTPTNLGAAILEALAVGVPFERTAAQLVEYRVMPRWNGYWATKLYAGELSSVVGPTLAMLAHRPECSDISCEDRVNIHSGQLCPACAVRREDRKAVQDRPEVSGPIGSLPTQRPFAVVETSEGRDPECANDMCGRPLPKGRDDGLCLQCRDEAAYT